MARAPDKLAFQNLAAALEQVLAVAGADTSDAIVRRIRNGLAEHAEAVEAARAATDPVRMPRASFDPADPKVVGRMVSLALLAQPMMPLGDVRPSYGAGVYAIYYLGDHPLYARISGTETPIYVGKADPKEGDASTTREQGAKLTGRLIEHANTISAAEEHATKGNLKEDIAPIRLEDFSCRKLVCATNAQLVAEKQLIRMFWPVWNSDTKACWGMSKHGDSAKTRKNKRSPWDVVHPGRLWALDGELEDKLTPSEIRGRIDSILDKFTPKTDHPTLVEEMLAAFRQDDPQADDEPLVSPLGNVTGPSDDEAGDEKDREE